MHAIGGFLILPVQRQGDIEYICEHCFNSISPSLNLSGKAGHLVAVGWVLHRGQS